MNSWAGMIVQACVSSSLAVSLGLESPGPTLTPHLACEDLWCVFQRVCTTLHVLRFYRFLKRNQMETVS